MTGEKKLLQSLLHDTVALMCKSQVTYSSSLEIEGLIVVRVDDQSEFSISIRNTTTKQTSTNKIEHVKPNPRKATHESHCRSKDEVSDSAKDKKHRNRENKSSTRMENISNNRSSKTPTRHDDVVIVKEEPTGSPASEMHMGWGSGFPQPSPHQACAMASPVRHRLPVQPVSSGRFLHQVSPAQMGMRGHVKPRIAANLGRYPSHQRVRLPAPGQLQRMNIPPQHIDHQVVTPKTKQTGLQLSNDMSETYAVNLQDVLKMKTKKSTRGRKKKATLPRAWQSEESSEDILQDIDVTTVKRSRRTLHVAQRPPNSIGGEEMDQAIDELLATEKNTVHDYSTSIHMEQSVAHPATEAASPGIIQEGGVWDHSYLPNMNIAMSMTDVTGVVTDPNTAKSFPAYVSSAMNSSLIGVESLTTPGVSSATTSGYMETNMCIISPKTRTESTWSNNNVTDSVFKDNDMTNSNLTHPPDNPSEVIHNLQPANTKSEVSVIKLFNYNLLRYSETPQ